MGPQTAQCLYKKKDVKIDSEKRDENVSVLIPDVQELFFRQNLQKICAAGNPITENVQVIEKKLVIQSFLNKFDLTQ